MAQADLRLSATLRFADRYGAAAAVMEQSNTRDTGPDALPETGNRFTCTVNMSGPRSPSHGEPTCHGADRNLKKQTRLQVKRRRRHIHMVAPQTLDGMSGQPDVRLQGACDDRASPDKANDAAAPMSENPGPDSLHARTDSNRLEPTTALSVPACYNRPVQPDARLRARMKRDGGLSPAADIGYMFCNGSTSMDPFTICQS